MGFFADVIALAPAVFWIGDEPSGSTAADSSGNGRSGTYTGSVLLQNQASLIPSEPSSASFHVDGTDVWVARNDEAALDPSNNFTAICVVKPTSLAAQRDIIGKLDSWQLWLETDGRMQAHISPAWTSFLTTNNAAGKLVVNTAYLIGIRQNSSTAKASIWINGVNNVEVTKSNTLTNTTGQLRMGGSSTGGGRSFVGYLQGFAYWPTTALSDADMLALFNSFNAPPSPPTDPDPVDVEVFGATLVSANWPISVDDDNDTALIAEYSSGLTGTAVTYQDLLAAEPTQAVDWITARQGAEENAAAQLIAVDTNGTDIHVLTAVCADLTTAGIAADPIGLNKALRTLCTKTLEVLYAIEYFNGATSLWVPITTNINALRYDWSPPSALRGRTDVKLRVRGTDRGGGVSDWVESAAFTVPDLVPSSIAVTPGDFTVITWENLGLQTEGEYWDGVYWRTLFALQSAETYTWDTRYRKGTGVKIRLRTDDAGVKSAWVESSTFTLTGVFSGSFWSAITKVGTVELLWKMNEALIADQCADSSGNSRPSNFVTTTNVSNGNPSLIPNRPSDTCRRRTAAFGAGAIYSRTATEGWMATIKSMMIVVNPGAAITNLVQFAVINRVAMVGTSTPGQLISTVQGEAGSLTFSAAPTTGNTSHIGVSISVGRHVAYHNGVAVGNRSISALPAGGQDVGVGDAQAVSDYQSAVLWSTELDALQFEWLYNVRNNTPNDPPTTPGAFTEPDAGLDYDLSIAVAWGASTDPNGDAIEYYGEYWDPNLLTWIQLFNWQSANTFSWDTSAIVIGVGFKVRVKARDIFEEESDWVESGTFDIVHARTVPNVPALEWIWEYDTFLGFKAVFSSPIVGATLRKMHWRISDMSDMSNILSEWTSEGGTAELGVNPYDLVPGGSLTTLASDTDYWVDVLSEDEIGNLGARTAPVRGKTAVMSGVAQGIFARDASGNSRHGIYGLTSGTDGSSYLNLTPGSVGNRYPGQVLPGMPAWVRGFHTQNGQGKLRYQAATDSPAGVEIPSAWNWAILVRVVLDTPGHALYGTGLCGFAGARVVSSPLSTPIFGSLVAYGTALELRHTSGIHRVPIANLVLNEPTTLKIVGKAISRDSRDAYEALHPEAANYVGTQTTHLIYVNDVLKYDTGNSLQSPNDTPMGPLLTGWLDIAGLGSPFIGGVNSMWTGAILEWALWTHPEIDGTGPDLNDDLTMPTLYGMTDLSPANVIATDPQVYYQLNDPTPPEQPTTVLL